MRLPPYLWIVPACLALAWLLTRGTPERADSSSQGQGRPGAAPSRQGMSQEPDRLMSFLQSASPAEALDGLEKELFALPPAEAVGRIVAMLESGKNRATGIEFSIGPGQAVQGWPTLRTYLLDALHRIDPKAAAEQSRAILDRSADPDEWALALRNIASVEDGGSAREFLIAKTEELIRKPEWMANPGIGYLNAFDVLVHVDAVESAPLLSGLVRDHERRDLAHAAFLTMDRLVQRNPVEMLGRIAVDDALLRARPEMTAQQFARADLRDVAQREVVKEWLLSTARNEQELNAFAGVYPNNNHFVSHNLLTGDTPPSGADLAAHDREAKHILTEWVADPEFTGVRPHLMQMIRRLDEFVSSSPPSNPQD